MLIRKRDGLAIEIWPIGTPYCDWGACAEMRTAHG